MISHLPLTLLIAFRIIRGRSRTGVVSLISIFSTLGIVLGVAVLIIGLSAMNGFENELNSRVLSIIPHGHINFVKTPYYNWEHSEKHILSTPGIQSVSPYITFTGLLEHGAHLKAIQINGVSPDKESNVSTLPKFVLNDAWKYFKAGQHAIILGQGIANSLNIKVGDWVTIITANTKVSLKIQQPKRIRVQVSGIFFLSGVLDHKLALIPLADAQNYLDYSNGITGFEIKTDDSFNADKIIYEAAMKTMHHVIVKNWISDYGYMYNDIQTVRGIIYLAMFLVIGVACFNIVSTLVMVVKDKNSDIAILRTIGAKNKQIKAIFLWYGLLSSLIGSMIGSVIGMLTSLNLTAIIQKFEYFIGRPILSSDIYFINFLPSQLNLLDVVYVCLTTVILSLMASWYPAHQASKLDPAHILSSQ